MGRTITIGLLVCLAIIACNMNIPVAQEISTITGVLTDDFQIVTADGSIYTVELSNSSSEMFDHTDKRVKATGILELTEYGPLFIVTEFVIVD